MLYKPTELGASKIKTERRSGTGTGKTRLPKLVATAQIAQTTAGGTH
jgi:hypothetical protein